MNDNPGEYNTQKHQAESKEDSNFSRKASCKNKKKVEVSLLVQRFLEKSGFQHKTLWDVVQLFGALAVPIVIFLATQSFEARTQQIADHNRNQEILSTYLDDLTELLLVYHLRDSQDNSRNSESDVQLVAQAKTSNTIQKFEDNDVSKGEIIRFLYITKLIGNCQMTRQLAPINCQPAILQLQNTELDEVIIPSTKVFTGIDLRGAQLPQAYLAGKDLSKAQLQNTNLRDADLSNTLLQNANLTKASLNSANLSGAWINRAALNNTILRDANLEGANLEHSILQNTDLRGANLDGASLQNTDLRGANLDGVSLQGADLKGAEYNSKTQFPEDFNPNGKGMTLIP